MSAGFSRFPKYSKTSLYPHLQLVRLHPTSNDRLRSTAFISWAAWLTESFVPWPHQMQISVFRFSHCPSHTPLGLALAVSWVPEAKPRSIRLLLLDSSLHFRCQASGSEVAAMKRHQPPYSHCPLSNKGREHSSLEVNSPNLPWTTDKAQ